MSNSETLSEAQALEELTPAQKGRREKNLAHLLIIAHREGTPAAIQELRRMREEKRAKARSSPTA